MASKVSIISFWDATKRSSHILYPRTHFEGKTSACKPLKRNQEIESYIWAIENPQLMTRIQAARVWAEQNFDGIQDWDIFKRQLRFKFRGTYADFFKVLYDHGITERQVLINFFLEVEASVSQVYRDCRGAVGQLSVSGDSGLRSDRSS